MKIKQYLMYLFRWQCSTPILVVVIWALPFNSIIESVVANFIGGLIFYWIDRLIFRSTTLHIWWQTKQGTCSDCGKVGPVRRVVRAGRYNREDDEHPQYRCEECSQVKLQQIQDQI